VKKTEKVRNAPEAKNSPGSQTWESVHEARSDFYTLKLTL